MAADTPLDEIRLSDIRIPSARIGVYEHEQQRGQPVTIHVRLWANLSAAAQAEDLGATIDYSAVCAAVQDFAQSRHFPLVETLCAATAERLLANFPGAQRVRVEVNKPWALTTGSVTIVMEKNR